MLGFVKRRKIMLFGCNLLSVFSLEWVSMNNQERKVRTEIVNADSNELVFYSISIKTSKFIGSCNDINDPYAKLHVPDVVWIINIKVFNLTSRTDKTRHLKLYETCKCKSRLDASVCNSKQRWNKNKCRCHRKELVEKEICDQRFIWNPSNCECKRDK